MHCNQCKDEMKFSVQTGKRQGGLDFDVIGYQNEGWQAIR